jgi:hypothetical protein
MENLWSQYHILRASIVLFNAPKEHEIAMNNFLATIHKKVRYPTSPIEKQIMMAAVAIEAMKIELPASQNHYLDHASLYIKLHTSYVADNPTILDGPLPLAKRYTKHIKGNVGLPHTYKARQTWREILLGAKIDVDRALHNHKKRDEDWYMLYIPKGKLPPVGKGFPNQPSPLHKHAFDKAIKLTTTPPNPKTVKPVKNMMCITEVPDNSYLIGLKNKLPLTASATLIKNAIKEEDHPVEKYLKTQNDWIEIMVLIKANGDLHAGSTATPPKQHDFIVIDHSLLISVLDKHYANRAKQEKREELARIESEQEANSEKENEEVATTDKENDAPVTPKKDLDASPEKPVD